MIEARGRSGYVETNGIRLHCLEYGEGEPTLVVVPGITSPAITWEFVAEQLDGRTIVLDVRGRGLSEQTADGFETANYAEDVAGLIAALGLECPVVLGHSMGARIVTELGARHPDAVGPLIVVDPPLTGPGRAPYPTSLESFLAQLHQAYAGTSADDVRGFYPRWPERELEIRADWLSTCDERAVVATYENFHVEDFFVPWSRLRPPLLFVYGGESAVVTAKGLDDVRRANPAAEVVGIPGAGHMIPWENLDDFLAAVHGFVSAHAQPRV